MPIRKTSRGPAPDPASAATREEFASRLRDLLPWSGQSAREVAQRAGKTGNQISPTTVTNLINGKTKPTERAMIAVLVGCDLSSEEQQPWINRHREIFQRPPTQRTATTAFWELVRPAPEQYAALTELWGRAANALSPAAAEHADRVLGIAERLLAPWISDVTAAEAALLLLAARFHGIGENLGGYLHRLPPGRLDWHGVPLLKPLLTLGGAVDRPAVELRGPEFDAVPGLEADLRFCAIALRVAELFDVADGRIGTHKGLPLPPTMPRGRINIGGLFIPDDRPPAYPISLISRPDHPSAEHALREYLAAVDRELLQCQAIRLDPRREEQIALPGKAATDRIHPAGYKYGEFRFELDRAAILELFMGEQLYDDPHTFLRELLQNAFDAVRLRHYLHGPDPEHRVSITCWRDETGYLWVRVDDQGIGMDEHALQAYFLRVGRSYYRSPEFDADLVTRGRDPGGYTPISRFGIGVLACFIVADAVEVSTRRLYATGTPGLPLRLSLRRDEDFYVLREAEMPTDPMPARDPERAEEYRSECGTSIAVRINPLRAHVSEASVAQALDRYLFCPPVPVTLNEVAAGRITSEFVERPWIDGIHDVEVPLRYRFSDYHQLPYLGPLRVAVVPLDLTRHSPTPELRGQIVGFHAHAGEDTDVADLLDGYEIEEDSDELAAAREVLRSAVTDIKFSTSWKYDNLQIQVVQVIDPSSADRAIEILGSGLPIQTDTNRRASRPLQIRSRTTAFSRQTLLEELLDRRIHAPWRDDEVYEYQWRSDFTVSWEALPQQCRPSNIPHNSAWLGHNGVAMPMELAEAARPHSDARKFDLNSGEALLGRIALTDTLRPDVSASRNQVRSVPFSVHSALHLAVRRAASSWPPGPFADFADSLARQRLITVPPAGVLTARAVQDPLVDNGAWDTQNILSDGSSIAGLRQRFRNGDTVEAKFNRPTAWASTYNGRRAPIEFHSIIQSLLLHARLQIAIPPSTTDDGQEDDSDGFGAYSAVLIGLTPAARPAGLDIFPPLLFLPYVDGQQLIRRNNNPWNSGHPVIAWIINHADELMADLPAAYDRIRNALELPLRPRHREILTRAPIQELAEVLAMIARVRPDLAPPDLDPV
ncbi:hypothetical protein [Dactylosporangium sp. NPDC051541]|uniref:hypothetical protein n=1 Tax=Dactylosporangium sp. NPDC051541 TaxID=3363977 RepID=UPI003788B1F3